MLCFVGYHIFFFLSLSIKFSLLFLQEETDLENPEAHKNGTASGDGSNLDAAPSANDICETVELLDSPMSATNAVRKRGRPRRSDHSSSERYFGAFLNF